MERHARRGQAADSARAGAAGSLKLDDGGVTVEEKRKVIRRPDEPWRRRGRERPA
jgi:hypothetical protein